jgi:anti-sigma factor (TIGR02949 family)
MGGGFGECSCEHCEEVMQPYMDRELTAEEHAEAEAHLDSCGYCRKRYEFESELRVYVKKVCQEEMSPELKAKLVALRLPDV